MLARRRTYIDGGIPETVISNAPLLKENYLNAYIKIYDYEN